MLQIFKEVELAIPSEVQVSLHARTATVKGPRGELTKVRLGADLLPVTRETRRMGWRVREDGVLGRGLRSCTGDLGLPAGARPRVTRVGITRGGVASECEGWCRDAKGWHQLG